LLFSGSSSTSTENVVRLKPPWPLSLLPTCHRKSHAVRFTLKIHCILAGKLYAAGSDRYLW
jgi:hypothetical protein